MNLKSSLGRTRVPLIVVICLILFALLHGALIMRTFWYDDSGNIRSTLAGFGDIPLHLTQISKFAFSNFTLSEPIYQGERLSYPFGINLVSGLLLRLSNSWTFSVLLPPLVLMVSSLMAMLKA